MKKIIPILLALCLTLSVCVTAVGSGGSDGAQAAEPFALFPGYLQLPLGQHLTLDAATAPAGQTIIWSSSDPSVASVDENGRVAPIAVGETTITATAGDVSSTCGVSVVADGNIFLWLTPPEPVDDAALQAALQAMQAQEAGATGAGN